MTTVVRRGRNGGGWRREEEPIEKSMQRCHCRARNTRHVCTIVGDVAVKFQFSRIAIKLGGNRLGVGLSERLAVVLTVHIRRGSKRRIDPVEIVSSFDLLACLFHLFIYLFPLFLYNNYIIFYIILM